MDFDYFDKYTFLCEMYDVGIHKIRELILNFFPYDNSIQVVDAKKSKCLLKRIQIPGLSKEELQIGNTINIFAKLLYIKDCAPATYTKLWHNFQKTFILIKPLDMSLHGKIITFIMNQGFRITKMKNGKINKETALKLLKRETVNNTFPLLVDYITSGDAVGLEVNAPNAIEKWLECLGASDPKEASPGTLRALFGEDEIRNVAHACCNEEEANEIAELFFGYDENNMQRVPYRATFENCTCCIIKPHVIKEGNLGAILELISSHNQFYISALAMFTVKLNEAKEFYEIYSGVLPEHEFQKICVHLAQDRCVVLEVKSTDPSLDVVSEFRKLCGPRDPELCRQLYPDTIRALYGNNLIENAVHCTDLSEDGEQEVEYFFSFVAAEGRHDYYSQNG